MVHTVLQLQLFTCTHDYYKLTGFSHTGNLHNPNTFATTLPDDVPIVLIFGAQATKGIVASDHPYVRHYAVFSAFPVYLLSLPLRSD